MKVIKRQKDIDYNRPTMWLGYNQLDNISRLRIIYPNGYADWFSSWNGELAGRCCWNKNGMTHRQSIKALKEYDKSYGGKTLFMGQI